jgi:hypothetical protein
VGEKRSRQSRAWSGTGSSLSSYSSKRIVDGCETLGSLPGGASQSSHAACGAGRSAKVRGGDGRRCLDIVVLGLCAQQWGSYIVIWAKTLARSHHNKSKISPGELKTNEFPPPPLHKVPDEHLAS